MVPTIRTAGGCRPPPPAPPTWRQQFGPNPDRSDLAGVVKGGTRQAQHRDIIGVQGVGPWGPVRAPDATPTGGLPVVGPGQNLRHAHLQTILTLQYFTVNRFLYCTVEGDEGD
jgi:hypothetical protein